MTKKIKITRQAPLAAGEKLIRMNFMTTPTLKKSIQKEAKERRVTPSRIINEKLNS